MIGPDDPRLVEFARAAVALLHGLRATSGENDILVAFPFGLERAAARVLIRSGELSARKIGRAIYARRSDLLALVPAQGSGTTALAPPTSAITLSDLAARTRPASEAPMMSAALSSDESIPLTMWRNVTDTTGTPTKKTWLGLVAWMSVAPKRPPGYLRLCADGSSKKAGDLAAWSAASFKGTRKSENVDYLTLVVADIDDGAHALDEIRGAYDGMRAIIHSTRSYTAASPVWRVVLAVTRFMTPAEHDQIQARERARIASLGIRIDPKASKDCARCYFSPVAAADGSYIFNSLDGAPLDVDAVLECGALPMPRESPRAVSQEDVDVPRPASAPDGDATADAPAEPSWLKAITMGTRARRATAWLRAADVSVAGDSGHDVAMRVCTGVIRGFALRDGSEARGVLAVWNARCSPSWSPAELDHKIAEAMRVGSMNWGEKLNEKGGAEPNGANANTKDASPSDNRAPGGALVTSGVLTSSRRCRPSLGLSNQ